MTRVALLGPSRHPVAEPFAGGQESHVATLARALRRRGHHVVLHAAPGSDPTLADELVTHPRLPELSAVSAVDPNLPEPGFLRDQHAFLGVVGELMRRHDVDVVHNSSLHHLPLVAATAVDRPLVTTLHTPPFPWMEVGAALSDPRAVFVAVSRDLAGRWTSLAVPPTVVPNGVDVDRFAAGPGGPDLAWVGRLVPEKGADLAVAAARRSGRRLRLVGPVSDGAWFDHAVRPFLGADVTYEGHLDQAAASVLVGESAALLVTPRWEEPFGLVAAEGALTGTPVVAIGRGGVAEVVDDRIGVLVAPRTSDPEQVRSLATGVERASTLCRSDVRRRAVSRFSADAMAAAYEHVYREAVAAW